MKIIQPVTIFSYSPQRRKAETRPDLQALALPSSPPLAECPAVPCIVSSLPTQGTGNVGVWNHHRAETWWYNDQSKKISTELIIEVQHHMPQRLGTKGNILLCSIPLRLLWALGSPMFHLYHILIQLLIPVYVTSFIT